jgi:hypothetical protein
VISAVELVVFPIVAGSWTYEPRDRLGRPAWWFDLEWNNHGGVWPSSAKALEAARRLAAGYNLEVRELAVPARKAKPRRSR